MYYNNIPERKNVSTAVCPNPLMSLGQSEHSMSVVWGNVLSLAVS